MDSEAASLVEEIPPIKTGGQLGKYPFSGNFIEILGHKIHYVEHGGGSPILFIH